MGWPLVEVVRILWPTSNVELYVKEYRKLFMDENLAIFAIQGAVNAVREIRESEFKIGWNNLRRSANRSDREIERRLVY